ncbi:MAG TPA: DALR domain-containing protein, partial [Stellaceae bacterium]|nr:DALR domain-containing protein [Stellaceae bacterium]
PWGRGRPGWHIECSAMSEAHLGETFDIHGGGLDLIFPHHENEIAQSVCAHHGRPFVRYWLHNGFLLVEGEKMSKSLGNFRTIRDVLAAAPGEAARYAMLMSHYRDPLDWTDARLAEARHALDRFYLALRQETPQAPAATAAAEPVLAALEDDLNTPLALAALHDSLSALNKANAPEEKRRLAGELRAGGALLGLLQQDAQAWLKGEAQVIAHATVVNPRIDELVRQRTEARRSKNFALADSIRAQLAMEGVVLEDKPDGTTEWRRT